MRPKKKGAWVDAAIDGEPPRWELRQLDSKQRFFSGQDPHTSTPARSSPPSSCTSAFCLFHLILKTGSTGALGGASPLLRRSWTGAGPWSGASARVVPALPMKASGFLRLQKKSWFQLPSACTILLPSPHPTRDPKIETQSREREQLEEAFVEIGATRGGTCNFEDSNFSLRVFTTQASALRRAGR